MIDEPKILTVPGIDTPLREQTLAEYCMALPPGHLALRELTELQRRSSEMFRLKRELDQARATIESFDDKQMDQHLSSVTAEVPPQTLQAVENLKDPKTDPLKKVPCIICGKPIALGKGYWMRHLKTAHPTAGLDLEQV